MWAGGRADLLTPKSNMPNRASKKKTTLQLAQASVKSVGELKCFLRAQGPVSFQPEGAAVILQVNSAFLPSVLSDHQTTQAVGTSTPWCILRGHLESMRTGHKHMGKQTSCFFIISLSS